MSTEASKLHRIISAAVGDMEDEPTEEPGDKTDDEQDQEQGEEHWGSPFRPD